ncbi:TMV resistance protein [Nymphaea thermarum]|nr:TMV resistance protein [Nymphaea thermarum]
MAKREGLPAIQQKLICGVLNLKKEGISIHTVDEGRDIIKRKFESKRVLIVLDNIVELDQLQKLLGDHICHKPKDLFGKGSKIVVTARDEAILLSYGIEKHQIHHPRELKPLWALQLFDRHAFKHGPPSFVLLDLAKKVAATAGRLPLVLVTIGSVFARLLTQEEWEGELEKIRKNGGTSIVEKLKWSYDGLDNDQKCVFLDIACFLVGAKRERATYLWDDRSAGNAIRVLQERKLIGIDDEDRFRMHDQIQEMGRWIVSSEGNLGPYMNSRLCYENEESITPMNSQERGKVEGIVLNMEEECTETSLTTKGNTFRHLEELSASGSKTLSEDEKLCFIVPLDSPSNPLLLQQLQCYGDGSKSGNLSNIYIKVCIKDMEDNLVIYETIFSGHRDFNNDIDGRCEYDDINNLPKLYRPCSICVSTADTFPLIRVDILLRSYHKWSKNDSKVIPVGENITNSRRISPEQNQPLHVLFTYVKEDIDTKFINNLYRALEQHGICIFKGKDGESKGEEYLLNCIERSDICIPIFSKGFSRSKWHLKSVAKMVEFSKFIIPVYFQVHPLDIRDQKGEFGTYFFCHKNEDQREIVEDWRKALEVVVRQCHHQFNYETNRYMKELITVICNRISSILNSVTFGRTPTWFGVKDVIRMLEKHGSNVCVVGICGPSGTGRMTIAKAIYDQLIVGDYSNL